MTIEHHLRTKFVMSCKNLFYDTDKSVSGEFNFILINVYTQGLIMGFFHEF